MGATATTAQQGHDGLSLARVLVVEDDAGVRAVLEDALTDEGYSVALAERAEAALTLLDGAGTGSSFTPHVVLLDLRLPGMSGADFAAEYRRRPGPHAPIVVITAAQTLAEALDSIRPDAVVKKPFELTQLFAQIESVLAASRAGNPLQLRERATSG
jgi:DNA-binding response OmpR family regulator